MSINQDKNSSKHEPDDKFYSDSIDFICATYRIIDLFRLFKFLYFQIIVDRTYPDDDEKFAKDSLYSLCEIIEKYSLVIYKQAYETEEKILDFRADLITERI